MLFERERHECNTRARDVEIFIEKSRPISWLTFMTLPRIADFTETDFITSFDRIEQVKPDDFRTFEPLIIQISKYNT